MSLRERLQHWTLWPMLWKEVAQLRRDRFTVAMMVGIPALQLVLFGYAIQMEVRHQKLIVLDQAQTEEMKRLTEASYDQNEEIKRISAWAAIIFAPTLIGTIYGMNFDNIPELHWGYGYAFALSLMVLISVGLWFIFRKRGWL